VLRRARVLSWLVVPLCAVTARCSWSAPEVVRRDWYFRETLPAIRDWEAILARWEGETPKAERTPVFPLPTNGQWATWPNPIPLTLLPEGDGETRMRFAGDKAEVVRMPPRGAKEQQTVALGEAVVGYKHPGGGAKDQWYHAYSRKFDGLTSFRCQRAPFALQLKAPLDFRLGANELPVALRNVSAAPLALTLRLRFLLRDGEGTAQEKSADLAPGAEQTVSLPVRLDSPGGGLLLLTVSFGGQSGSASDAWWLPLFTHVEDVPAVLTSVAQVLGDTPDAAAAKRLAELRHRAESRGGSWRALFEEASALRDELLLWRLHFDSLLFVKRKPFFSEQPFMDAHHLYNRPGGGLYRLSPVRPEGTATPVVDSLGEGVYRDVCLHWDAGKLLFSFGNGNDNWDGKQSYHVYEVGVEGAGLRQLTSGPKNDCEPFYLPNGQLGFTSDRSEHFVMCGGDRHAPTLFAMDGDGSAVCQLSFNVFNDFNPTVLPDGRILYGRWEYNERSVTSLHDPFTMHPDGTQVAPYYGNATIRPNVVMFPRPVPNSDKVMALFTAHHGQTHGPIGLIDETKGVDGDEPLTLLTPNIPVTGEKALDSQYGWYSDPMPLPDADPTEGTDATYLCSFTPTVQPWLERSWALYVGDRHGNLALVYRDPEISCAEPVPLVSRPAPMPLPPAPTDTGATDAEATLLLMDVYRDLPGVAPGAVKLLRVLEDVPRKSVHTGGVVVTAATSIYTIKRILGTVPVAPDGSANFVVPANRNVYFEALDENHREIQRMRSVVCLKPSEKRTCIGCHESRMTAPPNASSAAFRQAPSRPTPPPWGEETLSFLRDVQPLLNAKCVSCHAYDRTANGVILTDDLTDQFTVSYQELLPYLSTANAMRWDNPDDVSARPPYTYGSAVSRLTKLLEAGHHGVKLTDADWQRLAIWIDANAVYYDRYESAYPNRRLFPDDARKPFMAVYGRRCGRCHGQDGEGGYGTWWLSLNRRDARLSRALQAPLARAAGGWERCEEVVFTTTEDPDYQALLTSLSALRDQLAQTPREDLLSIRGTDAERQLVTLPPPPPRRPRTQTAAADGGVYLSDLTWESARAGWTPNNDGLPRRDQDVENHPLTLGARGYRKGLGTHAPSEIVYRLDGDYAHFRVTLGAAEANGTVTFQVFGDGKLLYDSGLMPGLREVKTIDLPVTGVRFLRLVVTDAGDGYGADMANWAEARVVKEAPDEGAGR